MQSGVCGTKRNTRIFLKDNFLYTHAKWDQVETIEVDGTKRNPPFIPKYNRIYMASYTN